MPNPEELAKAAYYAYVTQIAIDANFEGSPVIRWEDLTQANQQAWIVSTEVVSNEFYKVLGRAVINNKVLRDVILNQPSQQ